MIKFYAHSGNAENGITNPQSYDTHINNVFNLSGKYITDILKLSSLPNVDKQFMIDVIEIASYWHDVGKLDDNIQKYLSKLEYSEDKILNHVDAGVAITIDYFNNTGNTAYLLAACLIYSHHIGLQDWVKMVAEKKNRGFSIGSTYAPNYKIRDNRNIQKVYDIISNHVSIKDYINDKIHTYKKIQLDLMGFVPVPKHPYADINLSGLDIRLLFSCLVDADHSDTDEFYSGINYNSTVGKLDADSRIDKLDSYVSKLCMNSQGNVSDIRIKSRELLYGLCSTHSTLNGIIDVEAPVGTAKTTSTIKLALRMAAANNCDRIYTILPYINVISQTVNTYKKSILLDSENKCNINEIHSKTEFESPILRKYSKQWKYPINVSTAVQFFESLVSNNTSSIRKIHWFSNSVVILDEYDKAMPHEYWKYILPLLLDLNKKYNTHFILSSGTPINYFNLYGITDLAKTEVLDVSNWKYFQELETKRISTKVKKKLIGSLSEFEQFIFKRINKHKSSSALIVLNTIVNALLVFKLLKNNKHGYKVYQLSSSLTPKDKESILDEVKLKLINKEKIILVATTIIECGVDVSFDIGFKQLSNLSSVLQFNGRVNRHSMNDGITYVFDFNDTLANNKNGIFTENPQLNTGKNIFNKINKNGKITPEYCQESVREEIQNKGLNVDFNQLESTKSFNRIAEEFKIINSSTVMIIVDIDIISKIKNKKYVSANDINRNSIQLWTSKFNKIENMFGGLEQITSQYGDVYLAWTHDYDPEFYGIGHMLLKLNEK